MTTPSGPTGTKPTDDHFFCVGWPKCYTKKGHIQCDYCAWEEKEKTQAFNTYFDIKINRVGPFKARIEAFSIKGFSWVFKQMELKVAVIVDQDAVNELVIQMRSDGLKVKTYGEQYMTNKSFEFDFVGYSPEYGTTSVIHADDIKHAEFKAHEYIKEFYPELDDVQITESREV